MRRIFKDIAHRLVSVPLLGWLVQIVAAIYHLPKIRGQAHAAWAKTHVDESRILSLSAESQQLQSRVAVVESAWSVQLPQVLNVISSGNHHLRVLTRKVVEIEDRATALAAKIASQETQLAASETRLTEAERRVAMVDSDELRNVLRSVPASMRRLEREIAGRATRDEAGILAERLATETAKRESVIASLQQALAASLITYSTKTALAATTDMVAAIGTKLDAMPSSETLRATLQRQWLDDFERHGAELIAKTETLSGTLVELHGFVDYLNKRVEFIRNETIIAGRATRDEAGILAERLATETAKRESVIASLQQALAASLITYSTKTALAATTDMVAAIGTKLDAMPSSETLQATLQRQWLDDFERHGAELIAKTETLSGTLVELHGFVDYLNKRVEFIRNETMYEMRYGKAVDASRRLEVTAKVLARDKLEAARRTGIKLNLGCGHIPLDGFINVDVRELPGVDLVSEVSSLPFADGEVVEIHSAHLLEHFPEEQLRRELLPYWRRLLKPGGTFSAVVPDAEAMIRKYAAGEYPYAHLREVTFGGQDYSGDFHYNMLTPDSLVALLQEAGFPRPQVIASARANGKCFEFELTSRNPG